jgi:hypothetical protein
LKIKVAGFEIKKGGFFSSDYSMFEVETDAQRGSDRIRVFRKDADFYTLRRLLRV